MVGICHGGNVPVSHDDNHDHVDHDRDDHHDDKNDDQHHMTADMEDVD